MSAHPASTPIGAAIATRIMAITGALLALPGCNSESTFTLGRSLEACQSNVPTACLLSAGCVLDGSTYLEGRFPSSRRFVVRTAADEVVHIGLLLTEEKAPGTELLITMHEPGCGDRVTWDSAGRDLFRLADAEGVLTVDLTARIPGDHLVEFVADAYCGYALKLNP